MMQVNQSITMTNGSLFRYHLGSHHVAKLQNMVENTRQRLNDLKHSQKTVDRSYGLLQVRSSKFFDQYSINHSFRPNTTKLNVISMRLMHSTVN